MAEIATIARPYAEALFQVAVSGDLNAINEELGFLGVVVDMPELHVFADHPKVTHEEVYAVISGVLGKPISKTLESFLHLLISNGRLYALHEVAHQFAVLKHEREGVFDALVESAFPMDDATLSDLVKLMEKKFARKLKATVEVHPELIGGVRVSVGDEVLDTSVKARLEQMKLELAE
jgi:F-type H+-transporting ATPase subunit delta